jgi:hypothetical protein
MIFNRRSGSPLSWEIYCVQPCAQAPLSSWHILTSFGMREPQGHYKVRAKSSGFPFSLLPNDAFGVSVASIRDLDGDGVNDAVVGAYQ